MKNYHQYLSASFIIIILLFSCQTNDQSSDLDFNEIHVAEIARRANVVYTDSTFASGFHYVPPYISNGILGGSFDHMGFQSLPEYGTPNGRTVFGYIDHYYMSEQSTRQIQAPIAYIQAEFADGSTILNMMDANNYRQELDIYNGFLTTKYDLFGETEITAIAHQTVPNLFLLKIDRKAKSSEKELVVKINCDTHGTQKSTGEWTAPPAKISYSIDGNKADIVTSTNMVDTHWSIIAENPVKRDGNVLKIRLEKDENLIKLIVHRDDVTPDLADKPYEELLEMHTKEWKKQWEKSWINFPTKRAHNIWARANYYNISNFPVIPGKALIPTGMNGNIWGFTFPQDVYYVAENLTRTNHFDRYLKSMQYWLDILPQVKKYSERIMDVEGGFYPWTPPFDKWDEFEKNGAVSNDSYEIHNPAYVSAMVWHYYQRTGDNEFLEEYFPIMEAVWQFYSNVIHKNEKGTYDIDHHKAAGQDEASKLESSKNLLCASFSAEYSARNYLQAAELVGDYNNTLYSKASQILDAGLARDSLLKTEGYYATYEGDDRPPNSQKHPVQLNAITFVPMADLGLAEPSVAAWKNRYNLTTRAKKPVSHGWTFAAFALASSRMGSEEGFMSDLKSIQYFAGADPDWIQFYEFTFWERYTIHLSYYFPTHGLYQQAFSDALVQDWQGFTELFATVLPEWKEKGVSFKGLVVKGGAIIDGEMKGDEFQVTIHPGWEDYIDLKVAQDVENIEATGQKVGPETFNGSEKVRFEFDGEEPVIIQI